MKTLDDLKGEISSLYGTLLTNIEPPELTLMMVFILSSFSHDFPEIKSKICRLDSTSTSSKLYIESLSDEFLEIQYTLPIRKLSEISAQFRDIINTFEFDSLDESYVIQLTTQYINSMSSYYTPQKPPIISDNTGEFITITKDVVILYKEERIINPAQIPEHIYSILRIYTFYKFIEFIINKQFSNLIETNQKVFELLYGAVATDLSSGDTESIASVSLSGLSVSFNNKLNQYSSSLSSLASGFTNPTFIQEMNKMKDKYISQFKRKKSMFYNYLY